jgi:hypothetical protein
MNVSPDQTRIEHHLTISCFDGGKVAALFRERRLYEHSEMLGASPSETQILLQKLATLQNSIYRLDQYGERCWRPDERLLKLLWEAIAKSLSAFHLPSDLQSEACTEIHAYQGVELAMREGTSPAATGIRQFYRLKTCDVRLARRLLARQLDAQGDTLLATAWDLYDLASEVCDDLSDGEEDSGTYNANRFFISLASQDPKITLSEYATFLGWLHKQATSVRALGSKEIAPAASDLIARWIERRVGWAHNELTRWQKHFAEPVPARVPISTLVGFFKPASPPKGVKP